MLLLIGALSLRAKALMVTHGVLYLHARADSIVVSGRYYVKRVDQVMMTNCNWIRSLVAAMSCYTAGAFSTFDNFSV